MHTLGEQLAQRLERTVTGPMWHGPALDEVLADITPAQAAERPIVGAHTIWELVLHIAVWADIARARLEGPVGDPVPERDWPTPVAIAPGEWRAAVTGLRESYQTLAASVRELDDTALAAPVAGQPYSASTMLHGVVEHGAYHGGQIALLRRALARSR